MSVESEGGWFLAGVSTVVATLASAVAFLFKTGEAKNAASIAKLEKQVEIQDERLRESDKKHDECQQDRVKLTTEVSIIREHLARYINDNGGEHANNS